MVSHDIRSVQDASDLADELGLPRAYGTEAFEYYQARGWCTDDGSPIRSRGAIITSAIRRHWDITRKKRDHHPTVDEVLCLVRTLGFSDERGRSWHRQMERRGWPITWWASSLEGAAKKWREWGDEPELTELTASDPVTAPQDTGDGDAATVDDTGCPWSASFDPLAPVPSNESSAPASVTADEPVPSNVTVSVADTVDAPAEPDSAVVADTEPDLAAVVVSAVHRAVNEAVHAVLSEYVTAETALLRKLLDAMIGIRQGQHEVLQRMDALEQMINGNSGVLPF